MLFWVWLIYFAFGVAVASMAPLVAPISNALGSGNAMIDAILGAWPFAYIVAAIPAGIFLGKYGVRPMLFVAVIMMASFLMLRSVAESPAHMLMAVALFGIGGPLISVEAPKTIASMFAGQERAMAMGVYVTGPYLGGNLELALTNSVAMPLAGGDWRTVMLIYAGFMCLSGFFWLAISGRSQGRKPMAGSAEGKKFNVAAFSEILRLSEVRLILAVSIGSFSSIRLSTTGCQKSCAIRDFLRQTPGIELLYRLSWEYWAFW